MRLTMEDCLLSIDKKAWIVREMHGEYLVHAPYRPGEYQQICSVSSLNKALRLAKLRGYKFCLND